MPVAVLGAFAFAIGASGCGNGQPVPNFQTPPALSAEAQQRADSLQRTGGFIY